MNTILKTLVLAAAGAALIAASPASAQTHKRAAANRTAAPAPMMLEVAPSTLGLWQNGETTVNGADTFGQIRGEYLKDAPTHNGNSY
jgi:hypothetical protein